MERSKYTFDISVPFKGNSFDFLLFLREKEPQLKSLSTALDAEIEVYYRMKGQYIQLENLDSNENSSFELLVSYSFYLTEKEGKKIEMLLSKYVSFFKFEKHGW